MPKEKFGPEIERIIEETKPGRETERGFKGPSKKEVLSRYWEGEIAAEKAAKEAEREKRREWYRQPIGGEETETNPLTSDRPETERNEEGGAETEKEVDVKRLVQALIKNGRLNWKDREIIEKSVPGKGNEAQDALRLLEDEKGFLEEKLGLVLGKNFFARLFNKIKKGDEIRYLEWRIAKISKVLREIRRQLPEFYEKEDWEHEIVQVMDYLKSEIVLLSYKRVKSEDITEIAKAENEIDGLRSILDKLHANWRERSHLFKKDK